MPNGSNCALNHAAHSWIHIVGVLKRITVIMCKWHVTNSLYRMYTRMAIKSV